MIKPATKSILLTKPLKKMPKGLIYNSKGSDYYHLIESKTGKYIGRMCAYPISNDRSYYSKQDFNDSIFYIKYLDIEPKYQKQGWGEYFINFAKHECVKQNCGNRISLFAYNYEKSPHAFYYKQGFKTLDDNINQILAEYVKRHWIPFHWDAMKMFLDEGKKDFSITKTTKPENILIQKVKSILKFLNLC